MRIAVLKERRPGETRVAASPDTVKKFVGLGCRVVVERGAGNAANFSDEDFTAAGATVVIDAVTACADANMVFKVLRPMSAAEGGFDEISILRPGSVLVAHLSAFASKDTVQALAARGVTAFALELMPRISRAQAMDVLSSQSNLAGYKAVIDAAATFGRAMPMMMTAAGTIAPARVLVFGAGVAGLQAIATAKRMGAVVFATDVRYAAKEQVESLGGKFIVVDEEKMKAAETSGGYAKEMDEDFKRKQAEAVRAEVLKADIVVTTALIPGRPAPRLVTADMVANMKVGSVIVDLAAEAGGNVEGVHRDEVITTANGVTIIGYSNMPARLPRDASALFAKNILNFVTPMIDKASATFNINWDDEIVKGTLVAKDGQIVHPGLRG
ncbi:MAG: Re/Si-specific NAD(P)(+) transhydrogenase subunit alpha [Rhodospirillaceae bacterium]|nr:MAG: Re/Si-specific NAD(P)(+) transhydrogenase subunit alpha [Rhodospirillaceae bacterium]